MSAIGPTSAALGVRTPPVRITVRREGLGRVAMVSATVVELVTIVSPSMSARNGVMAQVVVPAEMAMAVPGRMSAAAAAAIDCLADRAISRLASKPGSSVTLPVQHRAAVDLGGDAGADQLLEVAPDRHVRDAQQVGQLADPDAAGRRSSAAMRAWRCRASMGGLRIGTGVDGGDAESTGR